MRQNKKIERVFESIKNKSAIGRRRWAKRGRRLCFQTLDVSRPFCHSIDVPDDHQNPPKYRDKRTAIFAEGGRVKAFSGFEQQAKRRLLILNDAVSRKGLSLLPSNHFEALSGDRQGQFSIRINRQWRICFEWPEDYAKPFNIEIVDYH